MSPTDARRAMLRAEIERDWEMVVAQLALAQTVDPSVGAPEAALVALSLDHAYQAFENVLVRLERALGLPARTGSDWHRSLLGDAVLSVAGLRPALSPPRSNATGTSSGAFVTFCGMLIRWIWILTASRVA